MKNWDVKKLRDLADIRVSNVDKKIYPSERPVKLCNYMDVYTNEYIDGSIQFMEGSANDAEIERFGLNIGDVIITKDSETPDDIGIPTVIHEQIDNLVCGYHLALIRPDNEKIDSIFLSKYLSTSRVANYFALHASGSTRFGLPIGAIESVEILTPPIKEQTQIATILSTIDRAIEQTEALITKQQRIKTGLMQDLLTKGIDENGNIRSEETHEFKDSPLGRIPVEWEVATIAKFGSKDRSYLRTGPFGSDLNTKHWVEEGIPVLTIGALGEGEIIKEELFYVSKTTANNLKAFRVESGDIVFSRVADIGRSLVIQDEQTGWIISSNLMRIALDKQKGNPSFLYQNIAFNSIIRAQLRVSSNSGGRDLVNGSILSSIQKRVNAIMQRIEEKIVILKNQLVNQINCKTGLMQDLLTGKVRVTDLLNQNTAAN